MINDRTAQRIASEWHGGQSSALYALSSTGAIRGERNDEYDYNDAAREIRPKLDAAAAAYIHQNAEGYTKRDGDQLAKLFDYVTKHGPRGPQPNWYERTIAHS